MNAPLPSGENCPKETLVDCCRVAGTSYTAQRRRGVVQIVLCRQKRSRQIVHNRSAGRHSGVRPRLRGDPRHTQEQYLLARQSVGQDYTVQAPMLGCGRQRREKIRTHITGKHIYGGQFIEELKCIFEHNYAKNLLLLM